MNISGKQAQLAKLDLQPVTSRHSTLNAVGKKRFDKQIGAFFSLRAYPNNRLVMSCRVGLAPPVFLISRELRVFD